MFKRIAGAVAALALAGLGGLLLASPSHANHNAPVADHQVGDCGETVFTLTQGQLATHVVGNVRLVVDVAGEVQVAVPGEAITVGPFDAGWHTIHWRVFGGGERDYDSPSWTLADAAAITKYAADHGGWWWTTAGLDDTAPFVEWAKLLVRGCPAESGVEFAPGCDGTTVTVQSGTFYGSYEWIAEWDGGSADLTLAGGESGELAVVPVDGGGITVDFAGSPGSWPQSYTWDEGDVDGGCDEPAQPTSPSPTPTADESPAPAGAASSGDSGQLPVTSGVLVPALLVTGAGAAAAGGLVLLAQRLARRPARFVAE